MSKTSKRLQQAQALIEKDKIYSSEEAMELAKKTATTKFVGSIEAHIKLNIDPGQTDQNVRGQVKFPHSTGKQVRVAAFVTEGKIKEAKDAGAEIVGGEEIIKQIQQSGKTDFDVAVAEPALMPKLASVAKILGPRGLMPNPKTGTVTPEVGRIIGEIKAGRVEFKNDDSGNVHAVIGRVDMGSSELLANLQAFIEAVRQAKPAAVKKELIRSVAINSTMGPGIRVSI